ncbi:MAG TPA: amidohydrolase, partial [Anaerolineales bacterium]|nr:amidohydrolase [Anaerolineales bacterium]
MPDLILYNGKLHTQDESYPTATALAIEQGVIRAVGADEEIRALARRGAETVDLKGKRVIPGLVDSHFHLFDWAHAQQQLTLNTAQSVDDLLTLLAAYAHKSGTPGWILGKGWNETRWPAARIPTRHDLDRCVSHRPVILWRSDMHLAVANSQALQAAGINANTPNPPQGVIDRDASGEPTGVLRELAINLVRAVIPPPSEDETLAALKSAFPRLHQMGLTGLHDFRIMGGEDGPPAFRAYQALDAARALPLRLWMNIPGERLEEAIALGLRTGFGSPYLRIGHLKLFSDGSQGARTAWMLEPYLDAGGAGLPLTPMAEIARAVRQAEAAGIAVAVHAIGDRANRELLDVFEEALEPGDAARARRGYACHRIEHVQNIRPDDIQRLAGLGLAASVQPIHATDDFPMIETSVGERSRYTYAFRTLLEADVLLPLGSDAPVANPNPLAGIHAAVTRQRPDGTPPGGWHPEHCLSVAEAVWGYTMAPALATGQASRLGSLSP